MNKYKKEISKKGIWFCFLLILFTACTENEKETPLPSGQTAISFSLNTETIITRASIENENTINSLYLLVFEESEGQFIFQEQIVPDREGENYTAELYATEAPTRLYFLTNIDKNQFSLNPNADTEAHIKERLIMLYPGKDEPEDIEFIPMWGYIDINEGINPNETINLGEVAMIRSLAAVTVENKADKFTLTSIQGYRVNNQFRIIPDQLDNENKVTQPSLPENETKITSKRIATNEGTKKIEGLYLPEAVSVTDINKQTAEATCLIIGGRYDQEQAETYYRVDFKSSQTFGQLLRNYRYNIIIQNVAGPGTTHPDEYSEVNIEYTIDGWSDSNHNIEL